MPSLSIETLDDPVVTDESPAFSGGTVSNARPANLTPTQFWLGENVDLSIIGKLETRRGTLTIGTDFSAPIIGIGVYSAAGVSTVTVVVNPNAGSDALLKIWNGSTWIDPGGGPAEYDPSLPVQMVMGNEFLWVAQAGLPISYFDGTNNPTISGFDEPINPAFIEWHKDRLVSAGMTNVQPDTLSFSEILLNGTEILASTGWNHNTWDLRVGGDQEPITGLRSWTNSNLVVFKEHSVWIVNSDPLLVANDPTGNVSAFPITRVHGRIGCLAPQTAVQVGADIFFLSESGVRSVGRTLASEEQSVIGPALSDPIKDIIDRINPAGMKWACATYWQNRYILSVPLDNNTYPSHTLVFNTLTGTWSGYWTGIKPTGFVRRIHGSTPKLLMGQADGRVSDFRDYTPEESEVEADYEDDSTPYPTVIESRAFTCGDQDAYKTGLFARMEFKKSQGDATVSLITGVNDAPVQIAPTFSTMGSIMLTLPFTLPAILPSGGFLPKSFGLLSAGQWREIRIRIESAAHKIGVNKISVGAFMDTFRIEE